MLAGALPDHIRLYVITAVLIPLPRSAPGPSVTQCAYILKGMPLCMGFPSTDMLYLPPRHNGDWSPPALSGTAADHSHSCLPAFPTACVHQAPTSRCNADYWMRIKRPVNGFGPVLPQPC